MSEHQARRTVARAAAAVVFAGLLSAAPPAVAAEERPEWGELRASDQVLRRGCRSYEYRYAIRPPEGTWILEVFLVKRTGRKIASGVFQEGQDPEQDEARFRLCRPGTRAGHFVIQGKLTIQDDHDPAIETEGWITPAHFRLRRPGSS